MRLVKYLAHSGVASRRASEELIADGRVSVGGEVVTDPARDVDETSGVAVDGTRGRSRRPRETWMLNKPLNVTSTADEPGRRRAVTDLVATERRLYPVGRLDADSTGLILLTNDGELANLLTHPRYGVPKTYRARLRRADRRARDRAPAGRGRARRRPDRAGRGPPGAATARSRSRSARAATARSGGWSSGSATGRLAGAGPVRLAGARRPRARASRGCSRGRS